MNIPNALSCTRLVLVPVLVVLARTGRPTAFIVVLACSMTTDGLDGMLARRLKQTSPLGARLDTWGDFATYMTLAVCAWWLWPDIMFREIAFFAATILAYLVPVTVGILKYGRQPSHHTRGAKVSALAVGITALVLFLRISPWPFRLCTPLFVLAGIEDTIITLLLPAWQPNVPSLRHALRLRRAMRGAEAPADEGAMGSPEAPHP